MDLNMDIDNFYEDKILNLFKIAMIKNTLTREHLELSKKQINGFFETKLGLKTNIDLYLNTCVEKGYLEKIPSTSSAQDDYVYRITIIGLIKIDEPLVN